MNISTTNINDNMWLLLFSTTTKKKSMIEKNSVNIY